MNHCILCRCLYQLSEMKTFSSCCPFNKEIRSDVILAIKKGVTDRFRRLVIRAGGEEADIKNRWVIHVQCSPEHTCAVFTRTYMYSVHQNIHVQYSPEHTCTVFTRTYMYSIHQNIHLQCSPEHTFTVFTRTYMYSIHQNIHVQCSPEHTFTSTHKKPKKYFLDYF